MSNKLPRVTRRRTLQLAAATAALPLVHIRTAGAAGKVSIGFWDHWVPAGNAVMQKQVDAWAAKNKVEVQADFISSSGGNKLLLTPAAETQAKTGHDVMTFFTWDAQNYASSLLPVDDYPTKPSLAYINKGFGPSPTQPLPSLQHLGKAALLPPGG